MKKALAFLVFNFLLFFVLSPGNFLTLPAGANQRTVAATHAAIFAGANLFLGAMVKGFLS